MVEPRTHEALGGRVIRPAGGDGVLLDDRHFRLEDITELTDALVQQSEGRLRELNEAARVVEERLVEQAEQGRAKIEKAMSLAQDEIDRQVQVTGARAKELLERRHREGFEQGHAEGLEQGEREGKATGYAEGLENGLERGLKEGREQAERSIREELEGKFREGTDHAISHVVKLASTLDQQWQQTLSAARGGLLELALSIAEGIVQQKIQSAPETVVATVERALNRLDEEEQLLIEIHPEDRHYVEEFVERFYSESLDECRPVKIVDERTVERGGVRVRGNQGRVDATISGQLETVRRRLEEAGGMP